MRRKEKTTQYSGTVTRFCPSHVWFGSPWEAAEIRWDNDGGSQVISLFETKSAQPAATTLPKPIREKLIEELNALSAKPFARWIHLDG